MKKQIIKKMKISIDVGQLISHNRSSALLKRVVFIRDNIET